MPNRVTTYSQAFLGVLGMPMDAKIKGFLKRLERDGHTLIEKIKELKGRYSHA